MMRTLGTALCAAALLSCSAPLWAQETTPQEAPPNVFVGFDFLIVPLAVKSQCGIDIAEDLTVIDGLITAFPEDAEEAQLGSFVTAMTDPSVGLPDLVGAPVAEGQRLALCAAAEPLNVTWLTPEYLTSDDESIPAAQDAAWMAFYEEVISLQTP